MVVVEIVVQTLGQQGSQVEVLHAERVRDFSGSSIDEA
jgi:hypothetical protein